MKYEYFNFISAQLNEINAEKLGDWIGDKLGDKLGHLEVLASCYEYLDISLIWSQMYNIGYSKFVFIVLFISYCENFLKTFRDRGI